MDKLLTVRETADALRVTVTTVQRYIRAGKLPAAKLGRGYRIAESDLGTFVAIARGGVECIDFHHAIAKGTLSHYVEARCVREPATEVNIEELFNDHRDWVTARKQPLGYATIDAMVEELDEMFGLHREGNVIRGIRLQSSAADDPTVADDEQDTDDDELHALSVAAVAAALGLPLVGDRLAHCPVCAEKRERRRREPGLHWGSPVMERREREAATIAFLGRTWRCSACHTKGKADDLAALVKFDTLAWALNDDQAAALAEWAREAGLFDDRGPPMPADPIVAVRALDGHLDEPDLLDRLRALAAAVDRAVARPMPRLDPGAGAVIVAARDLCDDARRRGLLDGAAPRPPHARLESFSIAAAMQRDIESGRVREFTDEDFEAMDRFSNDPPYFIPPPWHVLAVLDLGPSCTAVTVARAADEPPIGAVLRAETSGAFYRVRAVVEPPEGPPEPKTRDFMVCPLAAAPALVAGDVLHPVDELPDPSPEGPTGA